MPIGVKEIAWLAGLLEGEGTFHDNNGSPCITYDSTDEDVVERACKLFGVEQSTPYRPQRYENAKIVYRSRLFGARAIAWMQTIYVFMGRRRQEKIKDIVLRWKAKTRRVRGPLSVKPMAECHPDRAHSANGLCKACFNKKYREEHLEERRVYHKKYMTGWRARKKETQPSHS